VSLCAVMAFGVFWLTKPNDPTPQVQQLQAATAQSIGPLLDTLAQQVRATGRRLSEQSQQVTQAPSRLPEVDRVVNDLGLAIEAPLRQEMRRFADEVTRPWTYLAGQLPRPVLRPAPESKRT